jgi:hypothetical protein
MLTLIEVVKLRDSQWRKEGDDRVGGPGGASDWVCSTMYKLGVFMIDGLTHCDVHRLRV